MTTEHPLLQTRLLQAHALEAAGHLGQAEHALVRILTDWPLQVEALMRLSRLAQNRGDAARAVTLLQQALQQQPANPPCALDLAFAHLAAQQPQQAMAALQAVLAHAPFFFPAWLLLGEVRETEGDARGALKAWYQAVTRAQRAGHWHADAVHHSAAPQDALAAGVPFPRRLGTPADHASVLGTSWRATGSAAR